MPAGHDRRHHPLAARPRPREPAPAPPGARDRLHRRSRDALDEAAAGGRARERDRPPAPLELLGLPRATSARCATAPSRLRRLASWSPWGVVAQLLGGGGVATVQKVAVGACCALVVGGGAVDRAGGRAPRDRDAAAQVRRWSTPELVIAAGGEGPCGAPRVRRPAPGQAGFTATAGRRTSAPVRLTARSRPDRPQPRRPRQGEGSARRWPERPRLSPLGDSSSCDSRCAHLPQANPTEAERAEFNRLVRASCMLPPTGSRQRRYALRKPAARRIRGPATPAPPKGIVDRPHRSRRPRRSRCGRRSRPRRHAGPGPRPRRRRAAPTAAPVETPVPTETPTAVPALWSRGGERRGAPLRSSPIRLVRDRPRLLGGRGPARSAPSPSCHCARTVKVGPGLGADDCAASAAGRGRALAAAAIDDHVAAALALDVEPRDVAQRHVARDRRDARRAG